MCTVIPFDVEYTTNVLYYSHHNFVLTLLTKNEWERNHQEMELTKSFKFSFF